MSKTKEQLLASAEEIRTNTAPNSNTADLVGSTLKDMINKSSDDKDELQNNIDELSEGSSEVISSVRSDLSSEVARAKAAENAAAAAVTAEETRAKAAESALNTSLTGVKSDMNTLSLVNDGVKYAGLIGIDDDTNKYAANAIPTDKRKVGLIVTYLDKNGNPQTYQFTGSNISQWLTITNWQGIDDEPTAGSDNLVKSGGVQEELALGAVYDVSAKNPTAGPNNDGKFESLSALLSDANLSTLIPTPVRKGGMSIKFIQSSNNEYTQYRLKTPYFSIYKFNWKKYTAVDVQNQNETDLDVSDEAGNVIVRVKEGEIKTKNFDSRHIKIKDINLDDIDFAVSDKNNKLLVEFSEGEVKTKNFDSRNLKIKNTNNSEIDYAVSDENSNLIVEFSGGHVKTKNFDSRHITHFGTFSIIGDSYSAFSGYSGPNDNAMWYPNPSSGNNVLEIEQMWFYKFANEYKTALVQNDSYSGSTICYDGYKEGHDADFADISFCRRIERFTTPCELFLIFGGTNDSWAGSSIGDYKYSDWTEDDKSYFRPALAYLIDYINKHHIGTQIVFILNNGLSSNINTSIETICEHYSVPILKLSNIDKTAGHPNVNGMTSISEQLTYFLNHF